MNSPCYFCDELYPYPSSFLSEHLNGILSCNYCEMRIPIDFQENGTCCDCLNSDLPVIPFQNCIHTSCAPCFKTNYFGSSNDNRPTHWREITAECAEWPYDDDIQSPERIKIREYGLIESHFDYDLSYDEIITKRNNLMATRPEWMNSDIFLQYENVNIRYRTKSNQIHQEWDRYNENKIKGNSCCPLCKI